MATTTPPNDPHRRYVAIALAALALVGAWLRLRHLGQLGLILDEGVQALAVRGILDHGIPLMPSGQVYSRALALSYLQAAVAGLGDLDEFWLRLPAALCGVAVILQTYVLGRTLFDRGVGLLAAMLMTFSGWEIELSRYARSYTAFQLAFLVALTCFFRGFLLEHRLARAGFMLAGFVGFFTHEMSRILATLFAIPLFSRAQDAGRKLALGLWAAGFVLLWAVYKQVIAAVEAFGTPLAPALVESSVASTVRARLHLPLPSTPDFGLLVDAWQYHRSWVMVLGLTTLVATMYLVFHAVTRRRTWPVLVATAMAWCAFSHQFALAFVLLALYVVLFVDRPGDLWTPALRTVYGVMILCAGGWLTLLGRDPQVTTERAVVTLLGFPNFVGYFLHRFVDGWPVLAAACAIGSVVLLVRYLRDRHDPVPLFLLGAIYIPALATSFFPAYQEARYFFHLYPLSLIVCAMLARGLGARALAGLRTQAAWLRVTAAGAMLVALLIVSQDANPIRAWAIGDRDHRSRRNPIRGITNLMPYAEIHQDLKTPSLYVKQRLQPDDQVLVFGSLYKVQMYQFYLGRVDYLVILNSRVARLKDGVPVTPMAGVQILDDLDQVRQLVDGEQGGLWVLGDQWLLCEDRCHGFAGCGDALFGDCWDVYPEPVRAYLRELARSADYVGLDDSTFATRVR